MSISLSPQNPSTASLQDEATKQRLAATGTDETQGKNFRTSVINGRIWTRRMSPHRISTIANTFSTRPSKQNLPGILLTADTEANSATKEQQEQKEGLPDSHTAIVRMQTEETQIENPEEDFLQSVFESGKEQVIDRARYIKQTRKRLKADFKENLIAVNEEKRHILTHGNNSSLFSAAIDKSKSQLESAGEGLITNLLGLKNRRAGSIVRMKSQNSEIYYKLAGKPDDRGPE